MVELVQSLDNYKSHYTTVTGKLLRRVCTIFRNFEQKKLKCRKSTCPYTLQNSTFQKGILASKVELDLALSVLNIL